ncbi:putative methyltransferase C20orf7, mitochondrial isoform 1 precursor [Hyaloraphidium curvatum]|nr:putative methyltransferase C20orf7, mitochondrial isoform 1 precursor [Hyaloraphidium curvatum]
MRRALQAALSRSIPSPSPITSQHGTAVARLVAIPPNAPSSRRQSTAQIIFDREAKRLQRDRAGRSPRSKEVDYFKDEIAERMVDRLLDIKRKFNKVVDLGAGAGHIAKFLDPGMVGELLMTDMSEVLLNRDKDVKYEIPVSRMVVDEENLPFEEDSLDAVISSLSLHWVNDLPGALIQIRRSLKPDGVFLGALLGGDTLYELRTALQLAEMEREGGVSPHVSPMTDVRDVASLLSRAGFNLTTVDIDEITVNYPSMFELMEDLRAMGENNAVMLRKPYLRRDTLMAATSIYQELYGNEDGTIPATFQTIYMIGWKPAASQPKPAERGSGTINMGEFLKLSTPPPSDGQKE